MLASASPSLSEWVIVPLFGAIVGTVIGVVLAVLWSPFLLSGGIRTLFTFGPTRHWVANYVIGFTLLGAVHAALTTVGLLFVHDSTELLGPLVGPGLLVPAAIWVAGAFLVRDLAREQDALDPLVTMIVLTLGVCWYAILTVVPTFAFVIIANMPM